MNRKYADRIAVLKQVNDLTDELGRMMVEHYGDDPFMETAIQFARINVETPGCILFLFEAGYIAPAYIVMRWHHEMADRCFYLWKNPDKHEIWKNGKGEEIRPKCIGKFMISVGSDPGAEQYMALSDIVHGNFNYVRNVDSLSNEPQSTLGMVMTIGRALLHVMTNSHRMNDIFCALLKGHIGDRYIDIEKQYIDIEKRIIDASDTQRVEEKRLKANLA